MASENDFQLPIPERGFDGIEALIELGAEKLRQLAELQATASLDLSLDKIIRLRAKELNCEEDILGLAFTEALIPLNGIRRTFELSPNDLVSALSRTVESTDNEKWKEEHLEGWKSITGKLEPFFQPDNFFSQVSKAFGLLSQRPTVYKQSRILNELRPIFDEGHTKILALLQTCTLVLDFWSNRGESTLHITLDRRDLEDLKREIDEALKKIEVSEKEAEQKELILLTYGD